MDTSIKDFSVKGDVEAFFAAPEYEYTTTQRFVIYDLEEGGTKDGKGPAIIYPARDGGLPWELYEPSHTAMSQAVGPVSQTNRVLYVWTWFRQGKQHPDPLPSSFEEAWAEMEARGYQYGEDALEQVRFGWDLARGIKP